jgi:glycosyltransferase involved in cell wall biosynthesis
MTRIAIIDFVVNLGGGLTYLNGFLQEIKTLDLDVTIISNYQGLKKINDNISDVNNFKQYLVDHNAIHHPHFFHKIIERFDNRFFPHKKWTYAVPKEILENYDIAIFPWIHKHKLPSDLGQCKVIGIFHDPIFFLFPDIIDRKSLEQETDNIRTWLATNAKMIATSDTTKQTFELIFRKQIDKIVKIAEPELRMQDDNTERLIVSPYIVYPANTSKHKNHELLLRAYAKSNCTLPLVLLGDGTDFETSVRGRKGQLRRLCNQLGLKFNSNIFCLGYISETNRDAIIADASCLIMASRAEGGGSFPIYEAVLKGIPVISSDLPVVKEHLNSINAEVSFFKDDCELSLKNILDQLEQLLPELEVVAVKNLKTMTRRSWTEVSNEILEIAEIY